MSAVRRPEGPLATEELEVLAPIKPEFAPILTRGALAFVEALAQEFEECRQELLERRRQRQASLDGGALPHFLSETRHIRKSDWTVAPIPHDLRRRRVEITGPVERKMIINALNSGADVFMADFGDANVPSWDNVIIGQINLREAVRGTLQYQSPEGKVYRLHDKVATLMVRPRGWHLPEKHVRVGGIHILC